MKGLYELTLRGCPDDDLVTYTKEILKIYKEFTLVKAEMLEADGIAITASRLKEILAEIK